jgi:uncharacterized protein (TIGR03435 family)
LNCLYHARNRVSRRHPFMIRAVILAMLATSAFAQSFEAASVKLSPPYDGRGMMVACNGGPGTADPGRYVCTNISPLSLIYRGYQLRTDQVEWPHSPGPISVDITATIAAGTTKEQLRSMLQNLLAERFHLQFHWEKRDIQIYDLTVAKNGPKMKKSTIEPAPLTPPEPRPIRVASDGFPELPDNGQPLFYSDRGRGRARMQTMADVAARLTNLLNATVTDATNLTDRYDFTLAWAILDTDEGLPLIGAVEAQLGLKLVAKKGQKDVLVVDHMDSKPTEN